MTSAISNIQASLPLTVFVQTSGIFPSPDGSGGGSFIAELGIFAGNFGPDGAPLADGRLMAIADNDALFNLIGTTYGGDGQETFALPDLSGTALIGAGTGPGLPQQFLAVRTARPRSRSPTRSCLPTLAGPASRS